MRTAIRKSNFELLRIICMLMIVCGHLCLEFGKTEVPNSSFLNFIRCFCMCAINCFILISGYFSIIFKIDRIVKLILQTFFYSITIFLITSLIGWHELNPIKDFLIFFPIFSNKYWFITAYFILYIFSPYLNKIAKFLTKKQFKYILSIGFILFYTWPTLAYLVNAAQLNPDAGYGITNFFYLYLLGRYFKIHATFKHSSSYYLIVYLLVCISLFATHTGLSTLLNFPFTSFYSYNTIFVLFSAVSLFICFSKINIQSSIINFFSKSCLAVYLIHMGPYLWKPFCNNILDINNIHSIYVLPLIIFIPIIVYIICTLIDNLRILLFNQAEMMIIKKINKMRLIQVINEHYQSFNS